MFWIISLLILIVIAAIVALVVSYIFWKEDGAKNSSNQHYISFSKFIELYNLSPSRWELCCYTVKFYEEKYKYNTFCFSYLDFYKYLWWNANREANEEVSMESDMLKRMEEIVQSDIKEK